jgi:hypothetical protein
MNGDLKMTFILREVQRYLDACIQTSKLIIARKGIGETDELVKSFSSQARNAGTGAVGELIFKEYGRYVDMGAGRGNPIGSLAKTKVALQSKNQEGIAFIKNRSRKPKKFYSPVIYKELNYLQNRLLYGYSQETIDMLKKEIHN